MRKEEREGKSVCCWKNKFEERGRRQYASIYFQPSLYYKTSTSKSTSMAIGFSGSSGSSSNCAVNGFPVGRHRDVGRAPSSTASSSPSSLWWRWFRLCWRGGPLPTASGSSRCARSARTCGTNRKPPGKAGSSPRSDVHQDASSKNFRISRRALALAVTT